MLKLGKRMKAEDPERVLLLIPCGDVYANLLSQCGDDLREYFVYNTLDVNLFAPARLQVHVLPDLRAV